MNVYILFSHLVKHHANIAMYVHTGFNCIMKTKYLKLLLFAKSVCVCVSSTTAKATAPGKTTSASMAADGGRAVQVDKDYIPFILKGCILVFSSHQL